MNIAVNIFGTLILLLMSIGFRAQVVEDKKIKVPRWLRWFGNILAIASLIGAVAIWFT